MSNCAVGMTHSLAEPFDQALAQVHRLLTAAGFRVAMEVDLSRETAVSSGAANQSCMVLLVDTPELLFESIALDRSAAVFVPLHVVVAGGRETSTVHLAHPAAGLGLRPPSPAKAPLSVLYARLTAAISQLPGTSAVRRKLRCSPSPPTHSAQQTEPVR